MTDQEDYNIAAAASAIKVHETLADQNTRLAVVETRIVNIEDEMKRAREAQEAMREDVHAIRSAVDQGKGGLRLLLAFGVPVTILTGLLAAAYAFLQYLTGKG